MCSDPLDPGGEVRGCCVGCTLGMSHISPLPVAAALKVHREFPELKKCFFKRVCFGCAGYGVFLSFFFLRTHTVCYRYEAPLPYLHIY